MSQEKKHVFAVAVVLCLLVGSTVGIATWRVLSLDQAPNPTNKYSFPVDPSVLNSDETARSLHKISETAATKLQQIDQSVDSRKAKSFQQVLNQALVAYNTGTMSAFEASRAEQGFSVPDAWFKKGSPGDMLAVQADMLSKLSLAADVTISRKIHAGVASPEQSSNFDRRLSATVGIARGAGDVIDPIADKADAYEVAFPAKVRINGNEEIDTIFRVWLVAHPNDGRWLIYRWRVDFSYDGHARIMLPPL